MEVHGNSQLGPRARAQLVRQRNAVLHGRAFEGNERHDIGGPDARMLTLMCGEIDALLRDLHRGEGGGDGRLERRHEGDHRAMMRRVAGHIEHVGAGCAGDGVANRGDHRRIAAFREIRDAFDERHDQAG